MDNVLTRTILRLMGSAPILLLQLVLHWGKVEEAHCLGSARLVARTTWSPWTPCRSSKFRPQHTLLNLVARREVRFKSLPGPAPTTFTALCLSIFAMMFSTRPTVLLTLIPH